MTASIGSDDLIRQMLQARAAATVPAPLLDAAMRRVATTPQAHRGPAPRLGLPATRARRPALIAAAVLVLAGLLAGGVIADRLLVHPPGAPPAQPAAANASHDALRSDSPGASSSAPAPSGDPRPSSPTVGATPPPAWALPAGWRYDLACEASSPGNCVLHQFDEAGAEQDGWPVPLPGECDGDLAVGPKDVVYAPCTVDGEAVVAGLDRTGRTLKGWPVHLAGTVSMGTWNDFKWGAGIPSVAVGPDATVYVGITSETGDGTYRIHALTPGGTERTGWPKVIPGSRQGFVLGRDGLVTAWWYEGVQRGIDLQARRTGFTKIDTAGRTVESQPIGSIGAASGPVVWEDGSIFYVTATGNVYGHDRTGARIRGWPFALPEWVAPEMRSDGALVFVGSSQVTVLDRRGKVIHGWPYRTRSTLAGPLCDRPEFGYEPHVLAPNGTLYLAPWDGKRSTIVALDAKGRQVEGWPYRVGAGWRTTRLERAENGVITVFLAGDDRCGTLASTSIRLTAAGKLVGPPPATSLSGVYDALRLQGLRTASGATAFAPGSDIQFEFQVVNTASTAVTLPFVNLRGEGYYAAGSFQTWIERLETNAEIACLPYAGRKGAWYATGGWVSVSGRPTTIPPGGTMPVIFDGALWPDLTRCLPPGAYRYHVEYKPLDGAADQVIAQVRFDVEITADRTIPPAGSSSPSG